MVPIDNKNPSSNSNSSSDTSLPCFIWLPTFSMVSPVDGTRRRGKAAAWEGCQTKIRQGLFDHHFNKLELREEMMSATQRSLAERDYARELEQWRYVSWM